MVSKFNARTLADIPKRKWPKSNVNGKPRRERRNGREKVRCDCGELCHPFVLVDVSEVDSIPQDIACDGCRSKMEREYSKPPKKDSPERDGFDYMAKRHEWRMGFLKDLGAPEEVLKEGEKIRRKAVD